MHFVPTEFEQHKDIQVHKGIHKLAQQTFAPLQRWILQNKEFLEDKKVVFTGHSLGGALAVLLRIMLSKVKRNEVLYLISQSNELDFLLSPSVVTFGAPTVLRSDLGTSAVNDFLGSLGVNLVNVVTPCDPVARVLCAELSKRVLSRWNVMETRYNPAGFMVVVYSDKLGQVQAMDIPDESIHVMVEVNEDMMIFIDQLYHHHSCETYINFLN